MTHSINNPDIDPAVLDRWLASDPLPGDEVVVNRWLDADPSNKVVLRGMLAAWGTSGVDDYDRDKRWAAIAGSSKGMVTVGSPIVRRGAGYPLAGELRPSVSPRYKYVGVPLAIAATIAIGFFAIKHIPNLTNTTQSTPQTKTYATTTGQRANITLADGSRITIAPKTTIRVTGRTVDLNGEAVFTITQHTSDPFTVRANNTTTRVLGTTFGVRAYDENIKVAVQSGKVAVGQGASLAARPQDATVGIVLSEGDIATIHNGNLKVAHTANVAQLFSWTSGKLAFDDTPLRDVLTELARWYPIEFLLADPALATRRVSLTFESTRQTDVINLLETVLGVPVDQKGGVVTVGD